MRSCQQTHICAKALLLYLHRRRSLQSGVHVCARVRRPSSSMGFNALADLAATCVHACVRAGCGGRSGGSCWAALHARRYALHACRLVGWATGAWRDWSVGSVGEVRSGSFDSLHPSNILLRRCWRRLTVRGELFWKSRCSRHGMLVARLCGCHAYM